MTLAIFMIGPPMRVGAVRHENLSRLKLIRLPGVIDFASRFRQGILPPRHSTSMRVPDRANCSCVIGSWQNREVSDQERRGGKI
ncbi:MAG: hypothetical protein M2R45_00077 [Verrucomicrobia subdivision 3 bacterium]|nr:hypothetical protein [Limisphaerales bacterium]MCS1412465.1 hypothetical protein [Limisphaerales bacterium]